MTKKQISGGIVLSFFSQIITIIVGLVYTPYMIRILGQNEYGLYQLVLSVVNYLNLMNFGFNGAYIRFFYIAKSSGDQKRVANINGMFLNIFMIISLLCIFAGVLLYFNIGILGSKLTSSDYVTAKKLLTMLVFNVALSFPNSLFMAYMAANEDFIFQKALGIVVNILIPLLTLPLLFMGFGSVGVVSVTLFLTAFRLAVNMFYCFARLKMRIDIRFFDKAIFASLVGYTFFIFLSDIVDQLNSNVDKFLLGRITGTIAVAVYSVGYDLKNYYTVVSWIVPEMYIPEVNRLSIEEKDDKKLTELFTRIGRFNNYLVLLVLTGYILIGRQFISLWVGEEYDTAYFAGLILMISAYIPTVQTLGVNIQNAKNMHKVRSVVYFITACVNVICSIFLIKLWGIIGTCIGTALATIAGCGLFMNYYYNKYIKLDIFYFWSRMIKWFPAAIILFIAGRLVLTRTEINSWLSLFVFALIYACVYVLAVYVFGLEKCEKQLLIDNIRQRLFKNAKGA